MASLLSTTVNGTLNSTGRITASYNGDRYQMNFYRASASNWWITNDSDRLGIHLNNVGDKFYFANDGDFWTAQSGWLSTSLSGKVSTSGGSTVGGITYFSNGESMQVYGIRGRFANEYIHLYNKVGIGNPNGWGEGQGSTPGYGLSTYGGAVFAYGNNATSTFYGHLRIDRNWGNGDYGAEQFTIRGTYPSIALRSTHHNSKWLIHNDDTLSFYYGGPVDDNSWARKFFIPTDGNIWMSWAGDYISNLLGAKQNASTAITTSNIGSQSVNYANSAGSANAVTWGNVSGKPSLDYQQEYTFTAPPSPDGSGYAWVRMSMGGFNGGGNFVKFSISRAIGWNGANPYGGPSMDVVAYSREWHGGQEGTVITYAEHGSVPGSGFITNAGPRDLAGGGYWFYMRVWAGIDYAMRVYRGSGPIGTAWEETTDPTRVYAIRTGVNNVGDVHVGLNTNGDAYASRFYDYNDTAYYGDFHSRSVLNSLQLGTASSDTSNLKLDVQGNMAIRGGNGLYFGVSTNNYNSWSTRIYASGSTQYFNGQTFIFDNQGYGSSTFLTVNSTGTSVGGKLIVSGNTEWFSGGSAISLENQSTFARFAFNRLTFWDWNNGYDVMTIDGGYVESATSFRAPIFYDSADTTYYVDPAGNGTRAAFLNGNVWISPKSESYGEGIAFLMPSQATWGGLRWVRGVNNFTGAWAFGYFGNESNDNIGFHSGGVNGWRLDHSWNMTTIGSVRAPIFYDSDDTGYSWNPNTSSAHRFSTPNGYVDIGPMNGSWCHFQTDRPRFYFGNSVTVDGDLKRYSDGALYIHSSNYNSYAPTLTGGGASGSWGISITGSAGGVSWANVSSKPSRWLNTTNLIDDNAPDTTTESGFWQSYLGSGNPTGTWFNYVNVRHSNPGNAHGYQIGMSYYDNNLWFRSYQGNGTYQTWSRALGTSTDPYPSNMNQYVRTTDDVTHNSTTSTLFLVNGHSDNTKGYRIHNTSGSSVSAMFTNSSNQLVIAAGAVDQINLNKKVYVNGVALGVNVAPSATAGRIDASNDIVAFSSSDERLKDNITPIANALDKVKSLTGVEFDWKPEHKEAHGHEGRDTGIIAQQVLSVMPTAVRTNDTGYLAVRYEKLIGLLIEGMKEQQTQIDELKTKLDGLTK